MGCGKFDIFYLLIDFVYTLDFHKNSDVDQLTTLCSCVDNHKHKQFALESNPKILAINNNDDQQQVS